MDRRSFLGALAAGFVLPWRGPAAGWRAGVATVDITPRRSMWMAGFAARTSASQGVAAPAARQGAGARGRRGGRVVARHPRPAGHHDGRRRAHRGGGATPLRPAARAAPPQQQPHALRPRHRRDAVGRLRPHARGSGGTCAPTPADWRQGRRGDRARAAPALSPCSSASPRAGRPSPPTVACSSRPLGPSTTACRCCACDGTRGPARHRVRLRVPQHDAAPRLREVPRRLCGRRPGRARAAAPGRDGAVRGRLRRRRNPDPRDTLELVQPHGAALADAVDAAGARRRRSTARCAPPTRRSTCRSRPRPIARDGRRAWTIRTSTSGVTRALMLDRLDRDGRLPAVQPEPVQVWRLGLGPDAGRAGRRGRRRLRAAAGARLPGPAAVGGRLQQRRLRLRAVAARARRRRLRRRRSDDLLRASRPLRSLRRGADPCDGAPADGRTAA